MFAPAAVLQSLDAPHFAADDRNLFLKTFDEKPVAQKPCAEKLGTTPYWLRCTWGSELPRYLRAVPPRGNYRLASQSCEGQGPPGRGRASKLSRPPAFCQFCCGKFTIRPTGCVALAVTWSWM